MIIQIYEIQGPREAEQMIELGVDHIGSVIIAESHWRDRQVKASIDRVRSSASLSTLIPLFNTPDAVFRLLDYYRPDIVHFCEAVSMDHERPFFCRGLIDLQIEIKKRFAPVRIMRSIPIVQAGRRDSVSSLQIAREFEPVSDYFLTDTLLHTDAADSYIHQPVNGFVGITGEVCDWGIAAELVQQSSIPVILAGGISPDNVVEGICRVQPAGVDSCTGTNASEPSGRPIRFKKDPSKVGQLVQAVRKYQRESTADSN